MGHRHCYLAPLGRWKTRANSSFDSQDLMVESKSEAEDVRQLGHFWDRGMST